MMAALNRLLAAWLAALVEAIDYSPLNVAEAAEARRLEAEMRRCSERLHRLVNGVVR